MLNHIYGMIVYRIFSPSQQMWGPTKVPATGQQLFQQNKRQVGPGKGAPTMPVRFPSSAEQRFDQAEEDDTFSDHETGFLRPNQAKTKN